jgi:hypothetical protein
MAGNPAQTLAKEEGPHEMALALVPQVYKFLRLKIRVFFSY